MSMKGKNVVITGGTSGIGAALAKAYADEGAKVVIGGRREAEGARVAAAAGESCTFAANDVSDEASIVAFFKRAAELLEGGFDVVHLNAGIEGDHAKQGALSVTADAFSQVLRINVLGVVLGVREALPHARTGAHIFVTSSVLSMNAAPGMTAYCASKGACDASVRCLAAELAGSKDARLQSVKIMCINPQLFGSEMATRVSGGNDEGVAKMATMINVSGKLGDPADIGRDCIDIVNGKITDFKSGDNIVMDAGRQIWHGRENEARYKPHFEKLAKMGSTGATPQSDEAKAAGAAK